MFCEIANHWPGWFIKTRIRGISSYFHDGVPMQRLFQDLLHKEVQIAIIRNCVGPQIIDISDQFIWDEEVDQKKPDKLFEKPIDSGTSNIRNHSTIS